VAYDRGDVPWSPEVERSIREDELVAKYGPGQLVVGQVSPATLLRSFALIDRVGDKFSGSDIVCYDAGGLGFTAYAYDARSARYPRSRYERKGLTRGRTLPLQQGNWCGG